MVHLLDYALTRVNPRTGARGSGHAVGEQRPDTGAVTIRATVRRAAAEQAWARLRPEVAADAVAALGPVEGDAFLARADLALYDVHEPLATLYGDAADELFARVLRAALAAAVERPAPLRRTDRRREVDPAWFQRSRVQGYVCYVDRFCGTLDRLPEHLDHLEEVATALHDRGMALCIDLVLNHTAREHPWAQGWLAGDPAHAGFYTAFPDRTLPDAYDATIPEVFPDRAPGSFSWVPEACGG